MRVKLWLSAVALSLATAISAPAQENLFEPKVTPPPATPASPEAGKPWIGVRLNPADEVLAEHLGVTPGQAWLVEEVLADSPAAEAQIKRHDVLVSAGGKPLTSIEELSRVLADANGQPVTIELFRGGQRQSMTLTPKPAPAEPGDERIVTRISVFNGEPPLRADMPEGVEITVTKSGTEPAKVTVRRGRDTWEFLPDDSLERLPEDLRGPVASFLGRDQMMAGRRWAEGWNAYSRYPLNLPFVGSAGRDESMRRMGIRIPEPPQPPRPTQPPLEQRLEEIVRRLNAIEKSLGKAAEKAE